MTFSSGNIYHSKLRQRLFIYFILFHAPTAYFITTFSPIPMTWHVLNPLGGRALFKGFHSTLVTLGT